MERWNYHFDRGAPLDLVLDPAADQFSRAAFPRSPQVLTIEHDFRDELGKTNLAGIVQSIFSVILSCASFCDKRPLPAERITGAQYGRNQAVIDRSSINFQ